MQSGLQAGATGQLSWVVDASMVITLGGDSRATVFSTPNMILLMERAAREALRPFLERDEESVGIDVSVQHLSGAGIGAAVRGMARVTGIEGRRIRFDVEAYAGERLIGRGTHTRAVISVNRLIENLAEQLEPSARTPAVPSSIAASTTPPVLDTVRVAVDRQIATITLNRPQSRNAVNMQMTSDLEVVIAWLLQRAREVRVVLLTGAGAAFCAGDDLKELPTLSLSTARSLSRRQAEMYLAFERLPQPVIALVNGDAFGAGCVAAYSADLRIASSSARFSMPEITLGWPPGYGIAQLTALVGKARTLEMCLMGLPVSAARALEWGLVNEVVPGALLLERGRQLADRLLQMPANALRETKRIIHLDEGSLPKVAHHADTDAYLRCLDGADAREGLTAFKDKRPPRFVEP